MPAQDRKSGRDGHINMRVDHMTKSLIERAAGALGQTQTEFVISTARERALEVLMNRTLFDLRGGDWASFCAALDAPPRANANLKKLLKSKAPWDHEAKPRQKRKLQAA